MITGVGDEGEREVQPQGRMESVLKTEGAFRTYDVSSIEPLRDKLLHFGHRRPVGSSCILSHCWGACVGAFASQRGPWA